MSLITWDNSLSVNIKEIDEQHQKLIGLINDLHSAMLKGRSKEVLQEVIDGVIKYTSYHFGTEEKYFEKYNYADTQKHKEEHQNFVNTVNDFLQKFKAGTAFLSIEIMEFLKNWVTNHINGTDKKYTQFFNSKGLI